MMIKDKILSTSTKDVTHVRNLNQIQQKKKKKILNKNRVL